MLINLALERQKQEDHQVKVFHGLDQAISRAKKKKEKESKGRRKGGREEGREGRRGSKN